MKDLLCRLFRRRRVCAFTLTADEWRKISFK
jgi:hypothetical protein